MEAEDLCGTTSNVAVAAEITVNLPGKSVSAEQHNGNVGVAKLAAEGGIGNQSAIVSNDALTKQTFGDQDHAVE